MKELLVVIDYQNDFVNGALGFEGAEKLDGPIVEKIREYRRRGADVIFTRDTHRENYLETQEGRRLPRGPLHSCLLYTSPSPRDS